MAIKDSGSRQEFYDADGNPMGVRDIQKGKGRCDLLPLDVIAECFYKNDQEPGFINVFQELHLFTKTGDVKHLYAVLNCNEPYNSWSTMFLEVAIHFEEGAEKYGENNWKKGLPIKCYLNSAVRHFLKWFRGDTDEPHDRAFCWNIMCAIWTCKHKPELNDYATETPTTETPTTETPTTETPTTETPTLGEMINFLNEFCYQHGCSDACPLFNTACSSDKEDEVIKNYNTVKEYLANECNTNPGNP